MEGFAAVVFFILNSKPMISLNKNKFYFLMVSCFCVCQSEGIE